MIYPSASTCSSIFLLRRRFCGWWLCVLASLFFCGVGQAEFSEPVVEHASQFTVRIGVAVDGGVVTGTGFLINHGGDIVTNYHVVKDNKNTTLLVIYARGNIAHLEEGTVIVTDPSKDLAIVHCKSLNGIEPAVVAVHDTLGGQEVMAIGYPGILDDMNASGNSKALQPTSRKDEFTINPKSLADFVPVTFPGNIGKEMRLESGFGGDYRAIAHSAKISPGNSGGPLIDKAGRVVGINVQMATKSGADYGFAIHASELASLANANSIQMIVTTSKTPSAESAPNIAPPSELPSVPPAAVPPTVQVVNAGDQGLQKLLLFALAAFAVVMFLLVLRKPRMVMVDTVSRVVHPKRKVSGQTAFSPPIPAVPMIQRGGMRLRGRDIHGRSYDLAFTEADFRRGGGRLVVGRNRDLSQLHLSHDSVSRQHATLSLAAGKVQVEDRNSGNGSKVNGRELRVGSAPVPLTSGDKLTLGEVELVFEVVK
jgi:hypothetical protein